MRTPRFSIRHLFLLPLVAAFLGARVAEAQIITGQVLSAGGQPVAGCNINGYDTNGNEINLSNDGTDLTGSFSTTVDDGPGVYDFVFYPPAPPTTTHLVAVRMSVVVVTTTNLGTIHLGAGVLLSGRAVRTGSIPVSNVTLTVEDKLTGDQVLQVQAKTNAFGQFNLAVPPNRIELRLDATSSAFVVGSRSIERRPSGDLDLGDILLPPAAIVSGHVQRTNGTAVGGCDLDFVRPASGHTLYTPDDTSNSAGDYSLVVPLGTYHVEYCPKPADALAPKRSTSVTISGNVTLPTIVLGAGTRLFGTVLRSNGQPAVGVDTDVFDSVSGNELLLCSDNTNASGAYSVFVPTGTYDVVFSPKSSGAAIGGDLHTNVVVTTTTQLNGQLDRGRGDSTEPPGDGGSRTGLRNGTPGDGSRASGERLPPGTVPVPLGLDLVEGLLEVRGLPSGAAVVLLLGDSPARLRPQHGLGLARLLPLRADGDGVARVSPALLEGARFLRALVLDPGDLARHIGLGAILPVPRGD